MQHVHVVIFENNELVNLITYTQVDDQDDEYREQAEARFTEAINSFLGKSEETDAIVEQALSVGLYKDELNSLYIELWHNSSENLQD